MRYNAEMSGNSSSCSSNNIIKGRGTGLHSDRKVSGQKTQEQEWSFSFQNLFLTFTDSNYSCALHRPFVTGIVSTPATNADS